MRRNEIDQFLSDVNELETNTYISVAILSSAIIVLVIFHCRYTQIFTKFVNN